MDDLTILERLIQERLVAAQARKRANVDALRREMAEHDRRVKRFDDVARHVMDAVIRPRMLKLASLFGNAIVVPDHGSGGYSCACRFDRTPDYPASTELDIGLSPDAEIESAVVTYALEILPVFFQFDGHDQLILPLGAVDDQQVASWTDGKLLAFTDTYLRLALVEQYQQDNIVIDPVCGMRINRANAGASAEHDGKTYFFCVQDCRDAFMRSPERYVS